MSENLKYLKLLAEKFPNQDEVGKEIVLLNSALNLTKGTEIFLSDIHGEHEAFQHVLRNGSGVIRTKIMELFPGLNKQHVQRLASIIYYPEKKLQLLKEELEEVNSFYRTTLLQLIVLARDFSSAYTNRHLQELLPASYKEIILELIAERKLGEDNSYYNDLLDNTLEINQADRLITEFALLIQRLSIHKIHIIGDVYDRGPGAEIIMDELMQHHAVDFQWGNHDVVWMGASWGSWACMANVLRLSLRYANTKTLEVGYGINLMPLASFALEHYKEDNSVVFNPKVAPEELLNNSEKWLNTLMHKAIAIIQFKLENQLIERNPDFNMEDRCVLKTINIKEGFVKLNGEKHKLKDTFLPTVDPADPISLSNDEMELMEKLADSFQKSQRLQRHTHFLLENGAMYSVSNNNLLYHGCVPLDENGKLKKVAFEHGTFSGKSLMEFFEEQVQVAHSGLRGSSAHQRALDFTWYLWAGPHSPIFGKDKMTTFERYFIADKATHKEVKGHYYTYRDDPATCSMILKEFGLERENSVILNGHVPVIVARGEQPVKADGQLIVIDGGFCKAYQDKTGIAGYTLIHNQYGRQLVAHNSFESQQKAVEEETDIAYTEMVLSQSEKRLKVRDVDEGKLIMDQIDDLKALLEMYQSGKMKERSLN